MLTWKAKKNVLKCAEVGTFLIDGANLQRLNRIKYN